MLSQTPIVLRRLPNHLDPSAGTDPTDVTRGRPRKGPGERGRCSHGPWATCVPSSICHRSMVARVSERLRWFFSPLSKVDGFRWLGAFLFPCGRCNCVPTLTVEIVLGQHSYNARTSDVIEGISHSLPIKCPTRRTSYTTRDDSPAWTEQRAQAAGHGWSSRARQDHSRKSLVST